MAKVIKKSNLDPIVWSYKFDSDGHQYLSNTFTSRHDYSAAFKNARSFQKNINLSLEKQKLEESPLDQESQAHIASIL